MRRKKIINIVIAVFISSILFCMYFSKTIKNMLLPEVSTAQLKSGAIGDTFETEGIINYENTHKIICQSDWEVQDIAVQVNKPVKKGDILGKVDNSKVILEEREEQAQIMKLENELKSLQATPNGDVDKIKESQYELSTEKLKLSQIRKGLDQNGNILCDMDGKIVNISGQATEDAVKSTALFEIVDDNPKFIVKFEANPKDAERLAIGSNIDVLIKTKDNNKDNKITSSISEKTYNMEKDSYTFLAEINNAGQLKPGDKVTINLVEDSKRYDNVIPKACLTEEAGEDYVYIVKDKTNALGGELYVEKVPVQVIASDSINCAIKMENSNDISGGYGVVVNSSKQIEDKAEVKLDTER
ncbi:efflux RND transporter periplasmic adaptor subunit [Clostridium manihotivorum]|uniref:Sugar ABC transporter substrate-binding protein n=1 Tax=Clostridium manihotivorum TaxID=2320868 RepID=A0A410DTF9_9CLOT|nr:efflux RND transporter periplasmic adaptor subunit [Clostridium manihotivorum]QAA32320.1 sugar ABC transporter substrate-binding protein [Clostridium manihotivorum]